MQQNKINLRFITILGFIVLAAASRFLPFHNFTALGAISLFGAAHFAKKWVAVFITLITAWVTDLFVNNVLYAKFFPTFTWFYDGFYWQYGSYILIAIAAFYLFKQVNVKTVLTGALMSTAIFFLVSNFGVWASSNNIIYPKTFSGLITCYTAAIPFLQGTLLSDLLYSVILFGGFALAQKRLPILAIK
jgi:hypothetical protein